MDVDQSKKNNPSTAKIVKRVVRKKNDTQINDVSSVTSSDKKSHQFVDVRVTKKMPRFTRLQNEESSVDAMDVHTKEAYRIFLGQEKNQGTSGIRICGTRYAATLAKILYQLSAQDNPYADWALIQLENRIEANNLKIESTIQQYQAKLNELSKQGLHLHIQQSLQPHQIELNFGSAYGFTLAQQLVRFDFLCRVLRTLANKDLMSDTEAKTVIRKRMHDLRSCYEELAKFTRLLTNESIKDIQRNDFLETTDLIKQQKIVVVHGILGVMPLSIFNGKQRPRHHRRDFSAEDIVRFSGVDLTFVAVTEQLQRAGMLDPL
jgi:integrating conjugative element protein (TIGR03761 family)